MGDNVPIRKYLAVGERVQIILSNKNKHRIQAMTEIFYLMEPRRMLLGEPLLNGVLFEPTLQKPYPMAVYKNDLGEYEFKAVFVSQRIVNDKRFFVAEIQGEISLKQRRDFFRLSILIDIDVNVFEKNGDKLMERGIAKLVNISGGGLGLVSDLELEIDGIYLFGFEFEKQKFLLYGQVLRHRKIDGYRHKMDTGVLFVNMESSDSRRVAAAINAAQIKQLKKD